MVHNKLARKIKKKIKLKNKKNRNGEIKQIGGNQDLTKVYKK